MRPPCISTICLAMARPRPVPPLALVRELSTWWNCSKIRSCWSSGMPGPVSVTETAKWPFRAPAAILTSPASVNLMALPTRLSSTCVSRCSSPRPTGSDLSTEVVSVILLFWPSDSVAARTVSTTLSIAYSDMLRVNWPDSILAMSSTVLIRPSKCLPLERMRGKGVEGFRSLRLVEAFLDEFGVPQNGRERCPQLVAHVGNELVLVLAGDLKLPALPGNLFEEACVLQCNGRLIREALHETDDGLWKLAGLSSAQDECSEWLLRREEWDNERSTKPGFKHGVA